MNITVLISTFNRCTVLPTALQSIAGSTLPPEVEWEVLVVDNNSTDQTRAVVEEFCRRYPGRFRYLFEPRSGKSYALNSGIRESRGEIVAFTDDDVTVEATWLQNLTASLHDSNWAGTGGRTLPAKLVPLPSWLELGGKYNLGGTLCAHFDLGDEPCELDQAPYGANMAFRKRLFEKYGGFRTDLGASPGREIPRPNEDTEFGRRVMAAGERLRYEPRAIVRHPIVEDRISKDYFLTWYFDFGRAAVLEIGPRPDILGFPRPYLTLLKAILIMAPLRLLRWIFAWGTQERFYRKARVWQAAGEIREIHRRWFSKRAALGIFIRPSRRNRKSDAQAPGTELR